MLPWHIKRIFVICRTLHAGGLFLTIAHIACEVEKYLRMRVGGLFSRGSSLSPRSFLFPYHGKEEKVKALKPLRF